MPQRLAQLRGQGLMFTERLRAAEKAGGLWLAHQDSGGDSAIQPGDLVCFAKITQIDWLSQLQIVADCEIHHWAVVVTATPSSAKQWPCASLTAKPIELWPQHSGAQHQQRLQQALDLVLQQHPELMVNELTTSPTATKLNQLCWRWLELLPLPLRTKQRLLQAPSVELCLRYLTFILRRNDRFTELPR